MKPNFRNSPRGSILLVVTGIILVIGVLGVGLIQLTGRDLAMTGQANAQQASIACAEAGLQYAKRMFSQNYLASHNWNDYLNGGRPGRYDPDPAHFPGDSAMFASMGAVLALPAELRGDSNGDGVPDPGTDINNNGQMDDFVVTMRDDDDEQAYTGNPSLPGQDNNQTVFIRSECIIQGLMPRLSGVQQTAVIEVPFTYSDNSSGYGGAVQQPGT